MGSLETRCFIRDNEERKNMKQTDNYEFNLPESTDPVDIEILNENMIKIDNILNGLVDFFLPIGRTIITRDPTNPGEIYVGTSWVQIKDEFILAAGDNYTVNSHGGSADSVVISHQHTFSGTAASAGAHTHPLSGTAASNGGHTHTATTSSNGAHTHPLSGTATNAGAHVHAIGRGPSGYDNYGENKDYNADKYPVVNFNKTGISMPFERNTGLNESQRPYAKSAGAHTHSLSGTATNAGAHTHTLTTSSNGAHTHNVSGTATSSGAHTHTVSGETASTGESGVGKNMPPYTVKYIWERVA